MIAPPGKKQKSPAGNKLLRQKVSELESERAKNRQEIAQLRKSARHLRAILDAVPISIFHKDCENRLLTANACWFATYGLKEEEVVGKKLCEFMPPDTAEAMHQDDFEVIQSGRPKLNIEEKIQAGPSVRWFVKDKIPYRDTDSRIVGIVGCIHDINELKLAEEQLRKSEEQHRTILQTAMDGFWMSDMQGRLLDVNETYARMSGYSVTELLSMRISDLEILETAADTAAHIKNVIIQGEDRFETRHRRKDGSIFPIEISVQYRSTDGGRLVAFLRDITDRQRIENALRDSEEQFRTIFDRASDGMLIADIVTKQFVQGNATMCTMLGYTQAEIANLALYHIHPPQDVPHVLEEFERQITKEKSVAEALPVVRKDGSVFYADVSSAPFSIGGRQCLVGIFHDVTERKQAEQLQRRQREELSHVSRLATVGEFAASVAHEIHQPLTAILNNAQAAHRFLSTETPDINEVLDAIQDIIADDRRAGEVIRHLRLFLKREEVERTLLDINEVVGEVLTLLHGELLDRNVAVSSDLCPDLPQVRGSRVELQQVLMNLILNGCDAMTEKDIRQRSIRIETSIDEPDSITVAVQDRGTGLKDDEISRVFEHFYTTKREGLGIGLPISRSIIAAHGGRIWAANNRDGGATFYFTLPL